jgi:hypothetical protein
VKPTTAGQLAGWALIAVGAVLIYAALYDRLPAPGRPYPNVRHVSPTPVPADVQRQGILRAIEEVRNGNG